MKSAHFKIYRGRTSKWRFTLVAKNGEVVVTSELYTTKAKCLKGIHAVMDATHDASNLSASPYGEIRIVDTTETSA